MLEFPKMPVRLKVVIGVLSLQTIANVLGGLLLVSLAGERRDHGQDVPGLVYPIAFATFLVAAVLLVCLVMMALRYEWTRTTVIAVEVIGIASNLIALVLAFQPQVLVGIAIAVWVIAALTRQDVREWLEFPD